MNVFDICYRLAAGGGAGEDPPGAKQGTGDRATAPPEHRRGPGSRD